MIKKMSAMAMAFVAVFGLQIASAAPTNHATVLTGDVVSAVPVGTQVKEGDTLVTVQTLAGPMVAARSTVDGVIASMNVSAGQKVERGQVVAVVNSK